MNVTLRLPDDVVRQPRIRAAHDSQSLSTWMADLVRRELAQTTSAEQKPKTLIEALTVPVTPESFYEKDFPLPDRKETKHREFTFEPDED